MKDVTGVARGGTTFWATTSGGLFSWKEGSSTYQQFTTAEGLQTVDLTAVAVDSSGDVWAGASNGVIQVLTPATGVFRTLLSIANSGQTNKRINSLAVYGDTVLISTDFGLSLFRIEKFEFGDTYSLFGSIPQGTRVTVLSAAMFQGFLWAAITDGQSNSFIARASLSDPNLIAPNAWTLYTVEPGARVTGVAVGNERVYAGTTRGLYFFEGQTWTAVASVSGVAVLSMFGMANRILVGTNANAVSSVDAAGNAQQAGAFLPANPTSLSASNNGSPVAGTQGSGIMFLESSWTSHFPNGPNSNQFINVAVDQNGVVWCASGAGSGQGIYRYDGNQWTSFTRSNSPLPINEYYRITVGCNGSVWGSSWGRGVVEFPAGSTTVDSSHIYGRNVGMGFTPTSAGDSLFVATSNVVCDGRGNTWLNVFDANDKRGLAVRTSDGRWGTIPALMGGIPLVEFTWGTIDRGLAVDANDNLWAVVHDQPYGGVVTFGNAGTIDSTVFARVTSAQGLPSDVVRTIVVDKDNSLWVGTDKGIGIILDPSNPLRTGAVAIYKPLFGLVVNTIAVDPLNQKWVGTSAGVFQLSPDGTQQLAFYTVENTGGRLIDNDVKSIAVDEKSGTVYFGTNAGLASLTTSSAAPKTAFDELHVYPNPYYVPASVPLTVDGLMENSTLKILTTEGVLVREVKSPGGRVGYWDGTDQQGNSVASGIYVIAAYSESGSTANGKVAVIRR
ncbi:MAG: putative periplasmic ligand-binding sensor domain protein [Bacteroidetes bacterium]|nr:putative periplasmic ligand-binding sensor domain protein [Bacteroidota bacterium]